MLWYAVFHSAYLENLVLRVAFPFGIAERKVLFCTISTSLPLLPITNLITRNVSWNPGFVKYVHSLSPFVLASDNKQYGFICLPPFSLEKKKSFISFTKTCLNYFPDGPSETKKRGHTFLVWASLQVLWRWTVLWRKGKKTKVRIHWGKFTWDSSHLLPWKTSILYNTLPFGMKEFRSECLAYCLNNL